MTRATVRSLKKEVRMNADPLRMQQSALALLAHSVGFGHGRLAIRRLLVAVQVGAVVPSEHWVYCARVAAADPEGKLQQLYLAAATASAHPDPVHRADAESTPQVNTKRTVTFQ